MNKIQLKQHLEENFWHPKLTLENKKGLKIICLKFLKTGKI